MSKQHDNDDLNEATRIGFGFGPRIEGPPSESPIEHDLEWALQKYLKPDVTLERQRPVSTRWGRFRSDLALIHSGLRVGLECDGVMFHDPYRDEWRDALMLGTRGIDAVVRFAGQDLVYRIDDCVFVIASLYPSAFTERGHAILERLASAPVRRLELMGQERIRYVAEIERHGDDGLVGAYVDARIIHRRASASRQYWRELYAAALKIGPCTLDELIARDRATWGSKQGTGFG